ncbi:MAG: SseB family protein [Lachnospiraceae bacterium]|nr:SseB family protein [Lachnospiraceae bacterium]
MENENVFIEQAKRIPQLEQLYVIFGVGTRLPFVTCDEEDFTDQIWTFVEEEKAKHYADVRRENFQDILAVVKVTREQLLQFFSGLYSYGIDVIMFQEEERLTKLPLNKLVVQPDFSKLPEDKRPFLNPQMQLSGIHFMQEMHRKERNAQALHEYEEEMAVNIVRSRFLVPHEIEGDAPLADGSNIRIPCVTNKDGQMFQPIFTDLQEMAKFDKERKFRASAIPFQNIQKVMGKEVKGIVINPMSLNIILMADKIPALIERFKSAE